MLRSASVRCSTSVLMGMTTRSVVYAPRVSPAWRRGMVSASKPAAASNQTTALLDNVVKKEENAGKAIVGAGGKGAEGWHSNDALATNLSTVASLTEGSTLPTGQWTISHPIYTEEELDSVKIVHRDTLTLGDKAAAGAVNLLRKTFDLVTGYKHKPIPTDKKLSVKELREGGYILDQNQWLTRILLLETVAGIPGMVGGVLRHLHSLRLMRRDGGWINTLLSEAENERMHLLTFMTIRQPGLIFRTVVLGAQGVFFNLFFFAYLISPKTCHRFVGHLEEEACITYTRIIEEMEKGWIPEWEGAKAPQIAIDYWRLKPEAELIDVIRAVRADEATHRFVNHSLANLETHQDFNPFALLEPSAVIRGTKPGFTREESANFAREAHLEIEQATKKA